MDSMTFRSCALIMQDQYGLFLHGEKKMNESLSLEICWDLEFTELWSGCEKTSR